MGASGVVVGGARVDGRVGGPGRTGVPVTHEGRPTG
jgi:hypothetical protein